MSRSDCSCTSFAARTTVVPMGEFRTRSAPGRLVTRDLGSCVGVAIYSPHCKAGGLIHVQYPGSGAGSERPQAYADTAIGAVVQALEALGAVRTFLQVKIAGGANMFSFEVTPDMDIGALNVASVRQALVAELLRSTAEDVGRGHPRSMALHLDDGSVTLSTGGKVYKII